MMRVVVVGGTGNISTGIIKSLLSLGHEVTVFTLQRDIPEFQPKVSLEDGVRACVANMDRCGTMSNSDEDDIEDRLIAAQRKVSKSQLFIAP